MNKLLTNSNRKLAQDGIYVWSLPALQTCPMAGACKAYCYANKGFYRMPTAIALRTRNLKTSQSIEFTEMMIAEINANKKIRTVRIHDGGDFYNAAYLEKWIAIAQACPTVDFYAYTKMVSLVKAHMIPKNLRTIFSYGGKEDALITSQDRRAQIFTTIEDMVAKKFDNSSISDLVAAYGPSNKIGLIAH